MLRSTTTVRSQEKSALNVSNLKQLQKQRTATSNRTGGASSSAQTSTGHKATVEKIRPRIFDENNVDVTPKPMFEGEPVVKVRHGSALFQSIEGGTSTPTEVMSQGSVLNTNAMLTAATSFGAFHESSTHVSSHESNQQPSDSVQEQIGEREKELSALFFTNIEIRPKSDNIYETLAINETETFTLLDIPTTCLADEDPITESVKQRNDKYIELCKKKIGNDSFADRGMNTFNDLPKIKTTQTDRITICETGVMCTNWDMYDSMQQSEENPAEKKKEKKSATTMTEPKQPSDLNSLITRSKSSLTTATVMSEATMTGIPNENSTEMSEENKETKSNYQESESFKLNAFFMERLLNQNTYQSKQARYRGLKPINTEENEKKTQHYDGLTLEKLWTYTSALTKDRNVSCITWNNKNKDILAAGYGRFEYNDDQSGLVCCWCLKNPEYPERHYKTEAGVTSLAFSQKHANILAVGLFNGNIHIFDVRTNESASLISTSDTDSKHLSPVWNLKWTDRDRASSTGEEDEMEVLMSISSDGRITQWMIRKGFESSDYLKLKRVVTKGGGKKEKSDGLISRHTGGLCFDINDDDKSIYLCGTEEGYIHRCSTSYNEQYLDSYQGHNGPIYKIAWSPFLKNCFISASSDWTIKLWKTNRYSPCLTFNSSTKAVYDICWSTHSATLFCCVNENAVELWDLSKNTLDPIYVTSTLTGSKLTAISYSPNSDSLIVGTNDGNLLVYAIKNIPNATKGSDLDEIIRQSLISQLENIKIDEDEAAEVIEKHQLESLNQQQQQQQQKPFDPSSLGQQDQDTADQLAKLDAFNANLEKIKSQNKTLLDSKKTLKLDKKGENEDSSDSDD